MGVAARAAELNAMTVKLCLLWSAFVLPLSGPPPSTKAPSGEQSLGRIVMRTVAISRIVVVFLASVSSLSLGFAQAGSAVQPKPLYAIDANDNELAVFSLKAPKTVTVIGPIGTPSGALALAFCPPGGLVAYTIANPFDADLAQLATLNLATGAATPVAGSSPLPAGQILDIMGMACSRQGTLYAIGQFIFPDGTLPPDFNSLYTVDRVTGRATRIGSTGVLDSTDASGALGFLMALAFAPNGKLYGANSASTLFSIDRSTGAATKVVDLYTAPGDRLVGVMGLAIDSRGTFYVADFVPGSRVYIVDTATGLATPILNTGLNFVHNIAFRVPF
jgi:DNA-binding beta-propeller fold protein YncE